jgi:hypothetical protein
MPFSEWWLYELLTTDIFLWLMKLLIFFNKLTITKRDQYFTVAWATLHRECFHCELHCLVGAW